MSGAICGGNRAAANKVIKSAHCAKHKKQVKGCAECNQAYIDAVDANFMAVM